MDLSLFEPPTSPPRVPVAAVSAALDDARSPAPTFVHRAVARSVARGSDKTARLRLERLARVVMATDARITDPAVVWAADWPALPLEAFEALDAGIRQVWPGSAATRNAMRDAVRAVLRASLKAGALSYDDATRRLAALEPEALPRDEERQARGHLPSTHVQEAFAALAQDSSVTARRDTALVALLVGAGLRRAEAVGVDLADLDAELESVVVSGKGGVVRTVPLAPGVRRALRSWLAVRGRAPGPLLTTISHTTPRRPVEGSALSAGTVARIVQRRFGAGVAPHDLRRTFTGDLLETGADLSTVAKVLGHTNPATTAGYDRRGHAARLAAVERLEVPVQLPSE